MTQMDYFIKLYSEVSNYNEVYENLSDVQVNTIKIFCKDILSYRDHSIKQYNNDETRATDKFCITKFLNEYTNAINIFELHNSENCSKKMFNSLINDAWHIINECK